MLTILKLLAVMVLVSALVVSTYVWVLSSVIPSGDLQARLKFSAAVVSISSLLLLLWMSAAGSQEINPYGWNVLPPKLEDREMPDRRTVFDRCAVVAVIGTHHRAPPAKERPASAEMMDRSYVAACFEQDR
jgi:hypothetical protein